MSNNYITVTMSELKDLSNVLFDANYPMLIRGRHGIGKSEFVYQLAESRELPVIEMRASQMTEGDLVGLPFRGENIALDVASQYGINETQVDKIEVASTEFCPPTWYLKACAQPVILFFDEVDRAIAEVRQGLFQINDSRRLNGFQLHPETRIYACVNGGANASHYQVADMDPAELDRYTVFDLEPTVTEWLDWARSANLYPEVVAFIDDNSSHLEHKPSDGPYEPGVVYPSRRSWKRFSDALASQDKFAKGITENNASLAFMIASAFVGPIAAQKFRAFAMSYMRVVNPEQVLVQGDVKVVKNFTLPDIIEFCERIGQSDIYTQENLKNLNLDYTIKFLDVILNESKAIEAFEGFLEAVVRSAMTDESDENPRKALYTVFKHISESKSKVAKSLHKGLQDSLMGDQVRDSEFFKDEA